MQQSDEPLAFPATSEIEGIRVTGFPNPQSLFERVVLESRKDRQTVVHYLNIHVANTAFQDPSLKAALESSDLVYCDGAGIVMGAKMLGQPLPTRLTAADWFIDMLAHFAAKKRTVYLLGGEPGVPETALEKIAAQVPNHTVIGQHHGYILNAPETEQRVLNEINALKPDILIVGFGSPLQERWIEEHRAKLNVSTLFAIGAVMDFVSRRVSRCPAWMGDAGFEWLYRMFTEPKRLFARYTIGNPWFLSRIAFQVVRTELETMFANLSKHQLPSKH
ncbi:MAG TPA: WecB/TagA/CpsF family glycosyltransferase [Coleofasciculaceae cyanobacterium]|jgi:N-acetylglucosaminyldiphosphoundecaprenol N-acetyl-beta-D-mannosaminyltransferase